MLTPKRTWACPPKQVGQRERDPAIGHLYHIDAGHHLQQLACNMGRTSVAARRRQIDLAGLALA
jgi:hypothetical protein